MITFSECVVMCAGNQDLVQEFNRLTGFYMGERRDALAQAIDKACGYDPDIVPRKDAWRIVKAFLSYNKMINIFLIDRRCDKMGGNKLNGGDILNLQKLYFTNYRGFKELLLDLSGENIVFFGINGAGKSSILRGISQLFSNIIVRVTDSQVRQQVVFSPDDVMVGTSELQVYGQFRFDNRSDLRYGFSFKKGKMGKRSRKKDSDSFATFFSELYSDEHVGMPIFAHYGVNRTVLDIPLRIKTKHDFGKVAAYQNSLGKTDFRTFFEWFRNQEDIENQEKVSKGELNYKDPSLEAVRTAIYAMMPELSNLRIKRSPLRMCATKEGKTFSIEQLSDGEKCTLAMLGDIARRLSIANPDLENPLTGGGIVLIDEVDLHLHPSWQRKVAVALHKTFPNIQFIMTTHSPQVLGELREGFKIIELFQGEDGTTAREMAPGYYDSNLVLEREMGTPKVNPVVEELEAKALEYAASGDCGLAEDVLRQLDALTCGTSPVITEVQMLLYRQKRRRRAEEGGGEGK